MFLCGLYMYMCMCVELHSGENFPPPLILHPLPPPGNSAGKQMSGTSVVCLGCGAPVYWVEGGGRERERLGWWGRRVAMAGMWLGGEEGVWGARRGWNGTGGSEKCVCVWGGGVGWGVHPQSEPKRPINRGVEGRRGQVFGGHVWGAGPGATGGLG